jgi:glycosyltransferase involved in cell wall biosynthesis
MGASVSTIIAAYNAERTIAETVESALAQRYDNHEIVVVNDGSTDSTSAILNAFGARIRVVTQANRGAAVARNVGVAHSSGKYLAFLDADDQWLPGKLQTMVCALERAPQASLAFSEFGFIDENGIEYKKSSIGALPSLEEILSERPFAGISMSEGIMTSTWVLPRASFNLVGGFCETFVGANCEDSWLLVLLRDLGEFAYVPEKLTLYRVGQHSGDMADKYGPGIAVFVALAKKRYGSEAKQLVQTAENLRCRWLLTKIAHQIDRGERLGALYSLMQIASLRPGYFLSREFTDRMRLPQNTRRIRELMIARTRRQSP